MDFKELRLKSPVELQRLLQEKREVLRDRRFKVAQGQYKDVRELRELKQDIARLMTKVNADKNVPTSPSTPTTTK